MNILLATIVSYQIATGLPLKHDGYVVEQGTENGERVLVVKAGTERAFLYANYESNRWMNAASYPFVRDPHFRFRGLDVSRSSEPLCDWIAATGANAVYLKRGRPDARRLRECAGLGVPAYGFLYGCDAAKWNRAKYDAFVAAHPSAKGVMPPKSWEKGTMCPSDPATREFFATAIREIAECDVAGVVVCLWDDYGLNCVCDRCRANGMAGNWGRQVAFAVGAWERALKPLGKELIVRTWASGASHWLGTEWVHAPGYGGESGEPLSVWGEAMNAAGKGVRFQTKVYNADCQPDPPFSALLPAAPRREIAEWQITGQTVGLQYLPASVVEQTARQMRRVAELVSPEGGVMLYAGAYRRGDGYLALSDDLNSVNIHVWRQLSWNPNDDVETLWREWAEPRHGADAGKAIAAMKASERAAVAAFSPLGLGAPTESSFASNAERRESLLRYTNRHFLPEGRAALAPTRENIARVIAEKDAAIAAIDQALPVNPERFGWLKAQLLVSRALDGALWRYFHLRDRARKGLADAEDIAGIDADFETVRRHRKELCPGLGSPVPLIRDIREKAAREAEGVGGTAADPHGGETHNLNAQWRFSWAKETIPLKQALASLERDGVAVSEPAYDDSGWEVVSLPHPVNAHDSFDSRAVDAGEAAFRRGVMVYRKRFALPGDAGKAFLAFETVRQTVYLWVNGRFAGYYEAGIAPCAFDVTGLLKGGENVICVATDNCAARGAKIFTHETVPGHDPGDMSGAAYQWNTTDFNEVQGGLAGNVSLVVKRSKTYLTLPYYNNLKTIGTYVTAKDFDFGKGEATICVKAEVRNESGKAVKARLAVEVRDAADLTQRCREAASAEALGKAFGKGYGEAPREIKPSSDAGAVYPSALEPDAYEASPKPTRVVSPETSVISAEVRAKGLVFWSPDMPHLYDVAVSLVDEKGEVVDRETIRTGFRQVTYDAAKGGLRLNGKNVWLTGYAQRSTDEWAAIGVPPQWMQDYDAALIRSSNANFVRWMHVAPKPAPVRAFDKFGIVNVCPAGDKEGDVSGRAWAQRMEAMRDAMVYFRNSPSILFWEAGNNQISPAHIREMVAMKRALDPDGGRFMGCRTLQTKEQIAEAEYVGTMLHRHEGPAFDAMAALGRFMPMMETEYARQESPRRSWDDYTPPDYDYRGKFLNGGKKETGFDVYDQTQEDFALSTAKEYAQFWSSRNAGARAKTYTCCAALCWTDSNQHGRNSFSENCRSSGRVDAVRIPKMSYHVFRAMQSEDPAVTLVGHWSYPKLTKETYWYPVKRYNGHFMEETGGRAQRDPTKKTVYAIGSAHCASVELLVNGKSKGVNSRPKDIFVYEFPDVDVTEAGVVEAVARDGAGKEIARHRVSSFAGEGRIAAKAETGPAGWLADGADIAMVDFELVDPNGTVHPYASGKLTFRLAGDARFMGGWNSGTFDETSPVGKDFVNLECGRARVFVKSGRTGGKVSLEWKYEGFSGAAKAQGGTVVLEAKPVTVKGGLMAAAPQELAPNAHTYARRTDAPFVQDLSGDDAVAAVKYEVFVNGRKVAFPKGLGAPVKPDDNTGVCCALAPVLAALKEAGAKLDLVEEPKRIPATKKWLRRLSPTPFVPMVTVKAGGREIDACVGFTELFLDNGRDKNLTNCEIYRAKAKSPVVCGELAAIVGYIPGVEIKTDAKTRRVDLRVE